MSVEKMENEKPCSGRENLYLKKNSNIKNCFPIIYHNCPKTYCKNTKGFFRNHST